MARFECNGIDGFVLDMEEFAQIPDTVIDEMLLAGAEEIRKAHVKAIEKSFDKHTRKLIGSPTVHLKTGAGKTHTAGQRYALVYPKGVHHQYHRKSHEYQKYNWGRDGGKLSTKGGTKDAPNAEVAFVQEFGGHGVQKALGWMKKANDDCADAMATAEERAYDKWLKSLNL